MNDVGGSESGTGLRPKSSRGSASDTNFEYDDSEWDVGIGNLIIDLDADIEKNNEANRTSASSPQVQSSTSTSPMHIPQNQGSTVSSGFSSSNKLGKAGSSVSASKSVGVVNTVGGESTSTSNMEHSSTIGDKSLKMKIKRTKPGTKSVDAKHEIVKSDASGNVGSSCNNSSTSGDLSKAIPTTINPARALLSSPANPNKVLKGKGEDFRDRNSSSENNSKLKSHKKVPPQKKIKLSSTPSGQAISSTAGPSTNAKRENCSSDIKSQGSASSSINSLMGTCSISTKIEESNFSVAVPSSLASAFVKTASLKIPLQHSNPNSGHFIQDVETGSLRSSQQMQRNPHSSAAPTQKSDKHGGSGFGTNGSSGEQNSQNCNYAKKSRTLSQEKDPENMSLHPTISSDQICSESACLIGNNSSCRRNESLDACVGTSIGTITEPDCLGPCEPGTSVTLEGIVWHETENGVLVVNVTWRGKTYVGTLLDCTKNEWASPRFCDSPTSDLETRTPKNRGKRGRAQGSGTPVLESNPSPLDTIRMSATKLRNGGKGRRGSSTPSAPFLAPLSPLKVDPWPKRKTRGSENDSQEESAAPNSTKSTKRLKTTSKDTSGSGLVGSPSSTTNTCTSTSNLEHAPGSPILIECPEPNCSKKYKHINGLKYHQSHAHNSQFVSAEDSDSNMSTASTSNLTTCPTNAEPQTENLGAMEAEFTADVPKIDVEETYFNPDTINVCDESNSAPTTPMKNNSKGKEEGSYGAVLQDDRHADSSQSPLSLTKERRGDHFETINEEKRDERKEVQGSGHHAKPPILTVPSFVSLQSRASQQSKIGPHKEALAGGDQEDKERPYSATITWQPHSNSSNSGSHPSSAHAHLSVPTIHSFDRIIGVGKDHKGSFSSLIDAKRPKHKKKGKEKGDREQDENKPTGGRENSKNEEKARGSPTVFAGKVRDERKSSSEATGDDADGRVRIDSRDDPHSPAYSDISDANDSEPESDFAGSKDLNKVGGAKCNSEQLAKDNLTNAGNNVHSFSSFYSPGLYSPFEGTTASGGPSVLNAGLKSNDRDKSDEVLPSKNKISSEATSCQAQIGDRRSPKMDYQSKFLPQHFPYSYPYSNFHGFEQPYGMLPENYNMQNRSFVEEKERELQHEHSKKSRSVGDCVKDPSGNIIQIKQENEKERAVSSKESPTPGKSQNPMSKGPGMPTNSKQHKESGKREDKERDRYSNKSESSNSKVGGSRSSHPMVDRERQSGKPTESENTDKEKERNEGCKPTMETTGPPPPPTASSYAYLPPGYLQTNPFGISFETTHPLYRQVIVPGPYPGSPYGMHPGSLPRFPPVPVSTPVALPEDLSRPSPTASVPASSSKTDMLQHHATSYYSAHKIHELQERALKSPTPQSSVSTQPSRPSSGSGQSTAKASSPVPTRKDVKADLTKDVKPTISQVGSTSPPTQHHVHSHHHQHHHTIGFPILPAVPSQYSPHYVIPPAPAAPGVIPPFTSQKPT